MGACIGVRMRSLVRMGLVMASVWGAGASWAAEANPQPVLGNGHMALEVRERVPVAWQGDKEERAPATDSLPEGAGLTLALGLLGWLASRALKGAGRE